MLLDLQTPMVGASLAAILGLLIGSFLNVVIYRLPIMMEQQWAQQCAELSGTEVPNTAPLNLLFPRSRCPHCGHTIAWYENIPVLSYIFLAGKCGACKAPYGLRYPLIEATTGILFFFCFWHWGISYIALAWCGFSAALIALAVIDWDTTFLPDDITLALLWAGLVFAALGGNAGVSLHHAVWGSVAGYLFLWSIYWAFKLLTGKEGMGYGDFKLFAALGAWFGWPALIPIILMSSVIGVLAGIALKLFSQLREGGYFPFGPFLAGAGLTMMIFSPSAILRALGL